MYCDFGEQYLPARATKHSAGYDFRFHTDDLHYTDEYGLEFRPGEVYQIDTGVHLEDGDLRYDCVMLLFPRSSLGSKHGMRFTNTTGVIDADYRDSIKAMFTVDRPMRLKDMDRFMQGVIVQYHTIPNEKEPEDVRTGGIGSTGR